MPKANTVHMLNIDYAIVDQTAVDRELTIHIKVVLKWVLTRELRNIK